MDGGWKLESVELDEAIETFAEGRANFSDDASKKSTSPKFWLQSVSVLRSEPTEERQENLTSTTINLITD